MTTFVRTAGAIAAVLLLPALAVAADAPGGQTNILKPDLVNSIVTVVVFGALLAILYTFAWGPILKGLQAREEAQFQAIADAKKAKEEAAALRTQLAAEMAKAADQVRAILDEARRDAEALKVAEREVGVKEAQAERERAARDLASERDALLKEVSQRAVDLASIMATKAIRQQVTIEKQSALVDDSIAELNASASRA
ncbi:atp synthase f0 subunit b : ATP synthase subunit b OS=Isosphaera pallida (strain ATCC 43644 / DSM 9630 / IS1B) GN=atpF PE=3 SV=1: ATP-synt_B [Gemmata massiliana]|uniref:ATP synthase subunit b n=1 Tax=Gemmata massiliana TaxID=1210884 RepID=A0A6P2D4K0_9BACT|nr:ATP synthase F0 subunit B [Gemmata massiliana]VTR95416.1 atp synthase f0 subunit b : ATP synthase subunit b OS=Isosphaera pallida (strain ATCC 43644 / DSM 9630 / IS1B) GN=atpF PE=3 SV=1: ATP-synt_B [Gemmata massiliana]